jgi:hypothetical protein
MLQLTSVKEHVKQKNMHINIVITQTRFGVVSWGQNKKNMWNFKHQENNMHINMVPAHGPHLIWAVFNILFVYKKSGKTVSGQSGPSFFQTILQSTRIYLKPTGYLACLFLVSIIKVVRDKCKDDSSTKCRRKYIQIVKYIIWSRLFVILRFI